MSLTLLFISRRSINLVNNSTFRSSFLRPFKVSSTIFFAETSTLKSKYRSSKPLSYENQFHEATDDKTRRLKLQEHIRFREQYQLESDYELIYSLPKQRMFGLMHFAATFVSVAMIVFIVLDSNSDMLDIKSLTSDFEQKAPVYAVYSVAAIIALAFTSVLFLISQTPIRLYCSSVRRSYVVFYHPMMGVFRRKKLAFREDQYKLIPCKLDSVDTAQRAIRIRTGFGEGLFRLKHNFYFFEGLFRSKRDIFNLKLNKIESGQQFSDRMNTQQQQQSDRQEDQIWENVIEKKDKTTLKRKA